MKPKPPKPQCHTEGGKLKENLPPILKGLLLKIMRRTEEKKPA